MSHQPKKVETEDQYQVFKDIRACNNTQFERRKAQKSILEVQALCVIKYIQSGIRQIAMMDQKRTPQGIQSSTN